MSEKRVCAAPRIYMHFFGHFHPPNPPKGRAKARNPVLNRPFRTDSMRPQRIYSAKGAFTLSIDRFLGDPGGVEKHAEAEAFPDGLEFHDGLFAGHGQPAGGFPLGPAAGGKLDGLARFQLADDAGLAFFHDGDDGGAGAMRCGSARAAGGDRR